MRKILVIFCLLMLGMTSKAALISFSFTNSLNQSDTNVFYVTSCGPVQSDGTVYTTGITYAITPNTNGYAVTNLAQNNYFVTNQYLGQGYIFRAPLDNSTNNIYASAGPSCLISGLNYFVNIGTASVTATNITLSAMTNATGYPILSPTSITNAALSAAYNATNGFGNIVASNASAFTTPSQVTNIVNSLASSNNVSTATVTNIASSLINIATNGFVTAGYVQTATNGFASTNQLLAYAGTNLLTVSTNQIATNLLVQIGNATNNLSTSLVGVINSTNTLILSTLGNASNVLQSYVAGVSNIAASKQFGSLTLSNLSATGAFTNQIAAGQNVTLSTNGAGVISINATNQSFLTNGLGSAAYVPASSLLGTNQLPTLTNGFITASVLTPYTLLTTLTNYAYPSNNPSGFVTSSVTNQIYTTNQLYASFDTNGAARSSAYTATNNLGSAAFYSYSNFDSSGAGLAAAQQATNGIQSAAYKPVGYFDTNGAALAIGQSSTNYAGQIGQNATNYAYGLSISTSNGVIAYIQSTSGSGYASTNYVNSSVNSASNSIVKFQNPIFLASTNGVGQNIQLTGWLQLGAKTNFLVTTSLIGVSGGASGNGTYLQSAYNLWTNVASSTFQISYVGGSYYVQSNGISLYGGPIGSVFSVISGSSPSPFVNFGSDFKTDGVKIGGYIYSTNLTAQIAAAIAASGGGGSGIGTLGGAVAGVSTNNQFSTTGTNTIIALITQYSTSPTNGITTNFLYTTLANSNYLSIPQFVSLLTSSNYATYVQLTNAITVTSNALNSIAGVTLAQVTNAVNGIVPPLINNGNVGGVVSGVATNESFSAAGSNYISSIANIPSGSLFTANNLNVLTNSYFARSNLVLTLTASNGLIPYMTASNLPSGYAYASDTHFGYAPFNAFQTFGAGGWTPSGSNNSAWVAYEFPSAVTASYASFQNSLFYYNLGMIVQYSTNGTGWVSLAFTNVVNIYPAFTPSQIWSFSFPTTTAQFWRFYFYGTAVTSIGVDIGGAQIANNSFDTIASSNILQIASASGVSINSLTPAGYTLNVNGGIGASSVTATTVTSQTNNSSYIPNVATANIFDSGNGDFQSLSIAGTPVNFTYFPGITNSTITSYYITNCYDVATNYNGFYNYQSNWVTANDVVYYWTNNVSGWHLIIDGIGYTYLQTNNVDPLLYSFAFTYPSFFKIGGPLGGWPCYYSAFPYYGFPYYQSWNQPIVSATLSNSPPVYSGSFVGTFVGSGNIALTATPPSAGQILIATDGTGTNYYWGSVPGSGNVNSNTATTFTSLGASTINATNWIQSSGGITNTSGTISSPGGFVGPGTGLTGLPNTAINNTAITNQEVNATVGNNFIVTNSSGVPTMTFANSGYSSTIQGGNGTTTINQGLQVNGSVAASGPVSGTTGNFTTSVTAPAATFGSSSIGTGTIGITGTNGGGLWGWTIGGNNNGFLMPSANLTVGTFNNSGAANIATNSTLTTSNLNLMGVLNSANAANIATNSTLTTSNVIASGTFNGNANGLTNASRNLGVINYMSSLTNGNSGYDWTVANCTFPGQLGLSDYPGVVAQPTLWYGFTNGVGTNVWGVPFNIPAIQNLGNQNWKDIPNNPFEPMQFWLGMGPQQSSQEATWSSGTNNVGNYIQPDFIFRNANPWQGTCSLDMRAASTNSTFGYLAGNDKDGNPIYVSPFGFQIQETGPQYVAGLPNQAPSHCLLSSDSRFSTYFSLNGLRSFDSQYGQIPSLVLDTSTFATQTNNIAEQHAHPLFRVPKQVANTWMVSQSTWLDSLYIDTLTGAGTATNGLWTFGSVVAATNTSQYFKGNGGGLSGLQLKYQTNEIYTLTAAGYAYLAAISSTYVTSNAVVTTTAPIYTNVFIPDTNGLVAWYKMTEGTGSTTADSSGNGQTMSFFGSPSWVSGMPYSPVSSYAISFSTNGSIQYLTNTLTAFHSTETNVTLTAWVYCIGNIQNSCVFDGNRNGTNRTSIGVNNGYLGGNQFVGNFLGTETSAFQSGLFIPTNQWAFVAMVATTTNNIMYLGTNSVSLSSATYPFATPTPPQVENGAWLIGGAVDVAKFGNNSTSMNGYISDVRIYNRPLSAGEITGIFNLSN